MRKLCRALAGFFASLLLACGPAAFVLLPIVALAQSSTNPPFVNGAPPPTAAQWNSFFQHKLDYNPGGLNTIPFWNASGAQQSAAVTGDCSTPSALNFRCLTLNGVAPGTFFSKNYGTTLTASGSTVDVTNYSNLLIGPGSWTSGHLIVAGTYPHVTDGGAVPVVPVGANPTAQVGNSVVNGVATTFMRSDAAPPLAAGAAVANIGAGGLPLADIASQSNNTVVGNVSGGSASPTAVSLPSCPDTGGNHLNFTTGSPGSISCGTSQAASVISGYIWGFGLSNDGGSPNTKLDIAAGFATDSTNASTITLGAFTKTTGGSWVAGTGANGMGTGLTIAATTWYHVFAIQNNGAADVYFDTSVTAANKPASTTAFRRIGSFLTDGSTNIVAFKQVGNVTYWTAPPRDINTAAQGSSQILYTLSVPPGVQVYPITRYQSTSTGASFVVTSPSQEADLASASTSFVSPGFSVFSISSFGSGETSMESNPILVTNTSGQIGVRATSASQPFNLVTRGWQDPHLAPVW